MERVSRGTLASPSTQPWLTRAVRMELVYLDCSPSTFRRDFLRLSYAHRAQQLAARNCGNADFKVLEGVPSPMMNIFNQNAPRPPVVPGEEQEGRVVDGNIPNKIVKVPAPTPRTSSLYRNTLNETSPPLGFEPEGQSGSPLEERLSLSGCLDWDRSLHSLLDDPEGVRLFRKYLEEERATDALDFWFACAGLRKQPPGQWDKIVRVIYRRFFIKTQLEISEVLRKEVHSRIKNREKISLDAHVFDRACESVEKLMSTTSYPNFLQSETYLSHVRAMENGQLSEGSSSGEASAGGVCSKGGLATLHEDKELDTNTSFPPLTKDMLYLTRERRAIGVRPKTEAFAGLYNNRGARVGARAHVSFNPVSRQDSELQSLSSDARTDTDSISITESSVDGKSQPHHKMTRQQYQRQCQMIKQFASLNRDPSMNHPFVPRTQRVEYLDKTRPVEPNKFAAVLIQKLENLKEKQDKQENLVNKLFPEGEPQQENHKLPSAAKSLAEAIWERFRPEDDHDDQDILDQHVSRVWSDLTPSRTPGITSPRPKSPERRNRTVQPTNKLPGDGLEPIGHQLPSTIPVHPYQTTNIRSKYVKPRDKDVFSTFSSDSGNVHDFSETTDYRAHLLKSRSMPDYSDSGDTLNSQPSYDGRIRASREWTPPMNARRYSKNPELTDSGVSVVSETASYHGSYPGLVIKDSRMLAWLIQNDRRQGGGCHMSDRDAVSSCSGSSRYDGKHYSRGRRTPPPAGSNLMVDSMVPPKAQAEEVRRRLEDTSRCKQIKQRFSNVSQSSKVDPISGGSTLKKGKSLSNDGFTTVVFSFCDEPFPYRSKIPGQPITLRQFKEFLPKKGNYRFFFKTECEDLDMQVIQEEITDDNEMLPMFEGKVMAQVKSIE